MKLFERNGLNLKEQGEPKTWAPFARTKGFVPPYQFTLIMNMINSGLPGETFISVITYYPACVLHYTRAGFGQLMFEETIDNAFEESVSNQFISE